ncbi:hypothetical protein ETD86_31665 [Nonomuraea turkmeniaca]|uniref:ABC transporter ATP-binding protein n=1 Tax=Nonomuraea turkmeniaca TaxID=103838 RepID=A0A5S4F8H4_9ACTN|nr:hypothetical protein [Nonomuraea turkmeniaca]TMR12898.1 hypothetical protein ETD86_31665 [Nonomuraea turkmeniaca]
MIGTVQVAAGIAFRTAPGLTATYVLVMPAEGFAPIVVARLAKLVVRDAERIIVLEHGTIVKSGTHHEPMAAGGRYARLFRPQAQGHAEAAVA